MVDKQIKIRAVLDDSGFDSQIQKLEQKLSRLQKAAGQMDPQSRAGQYAARTYEDFRKESITDTQRKYDVNERSLQRLNRSLDEQKRKYQEIQNLKRQSLEYDREQEKILTNRIQRLEQASRNRVLAMGDQQGILQQFGAGPDLSNPVGFTDRMRNYRGLRRAGMGQTMSRGVSAIGGASMFTAAAGVAAFGAGAQIAGGWWQESAEKERNLAMLQGASTQMSTRPLQEQQQGKGIENFIFAQERIKGFQKAQDEMSSKRSRILLEASAKPQGFLSGAASVAAGVVGGTVGSALGPLGTAAGAGGAYGAMNLVGGAILDKKVRGALFNTDEFKSEMTVEALMKQKQIEDAEKEKNFSKKLAYQEYSKMPQYRKFQQKFGIENITDPNNMIGEMNKAGMTRSTGMELGSQLMSASGMTTGIEDVGDLRQMQLLKEGGLTNAAQVSGRIKGLQKAFGNMDDQAYLKELEKVFYKANKASIKDSGQVEEMRNFANVVTQIAVQKGSTAVSIAEELAVGGAADSAVGLSAAQKAFQMREGESGDVTGARGAMKWAFASSAKGQKLLGNIAGDFQSTTSLLTMPLSQINKNNPVAMDLAEKMGVDIDELKERKKKIELRGSAVRGATIEKMEGFNEAIKNMSEDEIQKYINTSEKEGGGRGKYADIARNLRIERGTEMNLNPAEMLKYIRGISDTDGTGDIMAGGLGKGQMGPKEPSWFDRVLGKGAKSPSIAKEGAQAVDELNAMNRLDKYIDQFSENASQYADISKKLVASGTDIDNAFKTFSSAINGGAKSLQQLAELIGALRAGDGAKVKTLTEELQKQSEESNLTSLSGDTDGGFFDPH